MKSIRKLAVVAVAGSLGLFSGVAMAGGVDYFGVGLGQSKVQVKEDSSLDKNAAQLDLTAGFKVEKPIIGSLAVEAVEVGVERSFNHDFGEDGKLTKTGLTGSVVTKLVDLGPVKLSAKVGAGFYDFEAKANGEKDHASSFRPLAGLTASSLVAKDTEMYVTYEKVLGSRIEGLDFGKTVVGVKYHY